MNKTPLPIEFSIRTVTVENAPFELMINTALLNKEHRTGFPWHWMITLKAFDFQESGKVSGEEKTTLLNLMQGIIQRILDRARIQIVGTTLYQGIFEVIFYGIPEDSGEIKNTIVELPAVLADREGRFVKYQGIEDTDWEKVKAYFEVFSAENN